MDAGSREARARSFAGVAAAYERARPGYPEPAVRWLVGTEPLDVLDLAAGTGKLTRRLVALGHRVVAVEPLPEMLAQLRLAVPAVEAREGTAEAIPAAAGTFDVAVAAQAFHWFDPPAALAEIARVLRPGGALALVWNVRDERVEWVRRLSELIGSEALDETDPAGAIAASGLYGPVEARAFPHRLGVDRTGLRELVLSRSACATRAPADRERVLEAVEALYDEVAGPEGLELPYVAEAYRARLR